MGVPFGGEPGFTRPVLIVQDDTFNASRISTIVVLPLTSNLAYAEAPGNVLITKSESKLKKDSVIIMSEIKVVDRQRLIEKISKVDRAVMEKVEAGMRFVLGMGGFTA